MRTFEERKREIYNRSRKRIEKRNNIKKAILTIVPCFLLVSVISFSFLFSPNTMNKAPSNSLNDFGSDKAAICNISVKEINSGAMYTITEQKTLESFSDFYSSLSDQYVGTQLPPNDFSPILSDTKTDEDVVEDRTEYTKVLESADDKTTPDDYIPSETLQIPIDTNGSIEQEEPINKVYSITVEYSNGRKTELTLSGNSLIDFSSDDRPHILLTPSQITELTELITQK